MGRRGRVFDVTQHGATGDGVTDCTDAIAAAVAAAARLMSRARRRPVVRFPAGGRFLTRPFNLSSGLILEVHGTILGATGAEALERWHKIPPLPSYGRDRDGAKKERHQALIMAADARDVLVRGRGAIDGQGAWWWDRRHKLRAGRPHLLELYNCTQSVVAGITLRNSPFWTLHVVYSQHVHIHHVTIRAPLYAPNADGIDPDSSRHVLIEHNDISCGDDHVAVKAGLSALAREAFPRYLTENVTVRHNVLRAGMGISIGSETSGGIRHVDVHSNVLYGEGWSVALHVKTTPHRGNMVEHISFRDNRVFNATAFIRLETGYQGAAGQPLPQEYAPTVIRNLSWVGNSYESGGQPRSKWICPTQYRTCEALTIRKNWMPAGSGWRCSNVASATVEGNSPEGLAGCMHGSGRTLDPRKARARKQKQKKKKGRGAVRGHAAVRHHRRGGTAKQERRKAPPGCPFCAERDRRWSGQALVRGGQNGASRHEE